MTFLGTTGDGPPSAAAAAAARVARLAWQYAPRRAVARLLLRACAVLVMVAAGAALGALVTYRALFTAVLYIGEDDVAAYLVPTAAERDPRFNRTCDLVGPGGGGGGGPAPLLDVRRTVTDEQLAAVARTVSPGGAWAPAGCAARHHTAVLVCYRDRAEHLRAFLYHVHGFLQRQNAVRYRVYVVEQTAGAPFNRGKLFNAGYREVRARSAAGCFVFHDVDMLPEHPGHVYGCTSCPRHVCANADVDGYRTPHRDSFGFVVAMTRGQFETVNGFSNAYYGWGGEDNDLFGRVLHAGLTPCRFDERLSRCTMLRHPKAEPNPERWGLISEAAERYDVDGVNTVTYELVGYEELPLYTRILVSV